MGWLKKNILIMLSYIKKRIDIIIDFAIIIIGSNFIYLGYLNIEMLIRAFILMLLLVSYKWLAHNVGIKRGFLSRYMTFEEWLKDTDSSNNQKKIWLWFILFLMNPNRVEKKWIMDILFWGFRIIPFWNWVGSFVVRIWLFFYDIRVLISTNRDIYYKKRGKNKTVDVWSIYRFKYGWIFNWVIIYPIYRIFLYPDYIRQRIFDYAYLWEIVRIRIIVYFYGIIYIYMGYYEYIGGMNWEYWLLIVYIYFAIIWPIILYIKDRFNEIRKWDPYKKPTIKLMLKKESVSKLLFKLYLDVVYLFKNSYIQVKYNYSKELLSKGRVRKIMLATDTFSGDIEGIWNYEKLYGVSFIVYRIIFNKYTASFFYIKYWLYLEGIKKLGLNFMKRYDKVIERMKDLYRCSQFFKMDLRRLMGYKKEEWLLEINKELQYLKFEKKLSKILNSEMIFYNKVPKNYIFSFSLYNKLFYYFEILISIENNQLLEFNKDARILDNVDTLIINLAKKGDFITVNKYELMCKKDFNEDDLFKVSEGCKKYMDYNINNLIIADDYEVYDYKFFKDLCKEYKLEYNREYEKLKDEYNLVSEKYIKEYVKKYMKKDEIRLIIWEEEK